MYPDEVCTLLYDEYLPFRLNADHKQGKSVEELSQETGMPPHWIRERIAAAEDCILSGQKLVQPFFSPGKPKDDIPDKSAA